jgi:catechol O-methyltransferase
MPDSGMLRGMANPRGGIPFFRWSFLRMLFGMPRLLREWQVGDGREERLARYVLEHARRGDVEDVLRVIDRFGYTESFLINVGDEKGKILDEAVRRASPACILELGAYCGYSALRMAACAPSARVHSVEFSPDNAAIATRVWEHAGVGDRVTAVVGTLGDGGVTRGRMRDELGFGPGSIDLVFIDHDKNAYLPDLHVILEEGWLRKGALVVADNVKFPGAPEYRDYMRAEEGRLWRTTEHASHVEYQSFFEDLVLVSEHLGGG